MTTPKTPQAAEPARCPLCKRHPSFVGSDALGYKIWCCGHTAATIYGPNPADTVQAWNRYVLANTAPAEPAQEPAAPEAGSMEDFAAAADLVNKLGQSTTKGEMLGLILSYRRAVREDALSARAPAVEPAPSEPDDTKKWLEAHSDATRRMKAALRDPLTVHAALLRGEIAKPDIRDMLHVYGAEALARWDRSEPAREEAMERDAERLAWIHRAMTGTTIRATVNILADRTSMAEFRGSIDASLAQAQPGPGAPDAKT